MAGLGPATHVLRCFAHQSRGWPAFSGHDTGVVLPTSHYFSANGDKPGGDYSASLRPTPSALTAAAAFRQTGYTSDVGTMVEL